MGRNVEFHQLRLSNLTTEFNYSKTFFP